MSIYVIGDIQGCYNSLCKLLEIIKFNPKQDRLWLAGDILNRGPDSSLMLEWAYNNQENISMVLGNHDLHALAAFYGARELSESDTLNTLFNHPKANILFDWLRKQPIIHFHQDFNALLVHAGIPPQFSLIQSLKYADKLSEKLKSDKKTAIQTLKNIFNNKSPDNNLTDTYLINAFTRMRHCTKSGELDLTYKGPELTQNNNIYKAWFMWENHKIITNTSIKIFFGHWAALSSCNEYNSILKQGKVFPLDTGCVWGKSLTAIRLSDSKIFAVNCRN